MTARTPIFGVGGLAMCFALPTSPLSAQDLPEEGVSAAAAGQEQPGSNEVYGPGYFERFAPRTALDMLNRVPGFSVENSSGSTRRNQPEQRGLGQANENILLNSQRLTSKSSSLADQLGRIPARNVLRIEILDGTALDIPGLSGQVANIVLAQSSALSGQFEWNLIHRPTTNRWNPTEANVSVSGATGDLDFTVSLSNNSLRFAAKGPTLLSDGDGILTETRETFYRFHNDAPKISADLRYDGIAGAVANLNLSYERVYSRTRETDTRDLVSGIDQAQLRRFRSRGYEYEIAGDIEFALGPGRLKLIGLESFNTRDNTETAVISFVDLSDPTGRRFAFGSDKGERIGRAEYSWPMLGIEWQLSGEAAFNRLDNVAQLFLLASNGDFVEINFPGGTGGVREDRYESILSASGSLSDNLSYQLSGGAEFSTISQSGANSVSRSFARPKGSVSLAWSAGNGWDASLEIARRVGQLDFGDFLATVSLGNEQQDAANARLVPQQSWEGELEITRDFGRWGNGTLTLFHQEISDLVDIIALPDGRAAKGNIASATLTGAELDATIELEAMGFRGARLDIGGRVERSRLDDPVDGLPRPFSRRQAHRFEFDFRHDVPQTDWAWGFGANTTRFGRYFRVGEFGREFSGPSFLKVFIENKDVFGLNARLELDNITGPRRRLIRTIFDGVRGSDPIVIEEDRAQRIGTKFQFTLSGNF
ncbi:TonB-dependent receptor plug domain-containing protein [Altererythrobacter sp. MF3-039]|uniref:TonB-dependent receptor plug domain-containing protein n=1 Tax=Altererythrobacter sp. MF3-039 TaxID=3252901 RepID=UPI00390C84F9